MQRSMFKDQERQPKPLIDVYELEEFDQRICYAMEYHLAVKLTVWDDGFTEEVTGHVHYVDPISHDLRIEDNTGKFEQIAFEHVVGRVVID
jgi:YolD-like protein